MSARPDLSVVVPVHNEASRVVAGLQALVSYLAALPLTSEIVLVDDGSSDETVPLARPLLPATGQLMEEPHRGKGGAVRAGMLSARGECVIFLDIDMATPLRFVAPCVERLHANADVVIGSRRTADARIERHQGRLREWLGVGFSLMSRLITGARVSDFTCGFKGFRRDAAQAIFSLQRVDNWSFDAEVLFLANRLGLRVEELPVVWTNDTRSKVRLGRDILGSLAGLLTIRANHLLGRYRR
ncbi:MAG: glycosyltransferase [Acidobacteria bacterium]|nr:glycosyltransferase [Acidobacteriota bacterium]